MYAYTDFDIGIERDRIVEYESVQLMSPRFRLRHSGSRQLVSCLLLPAMHRALDGSARPSSCVQRQGEPDGQFGYAMSHHMGLSIVR